ncbi:actin-binding LIM protein 1 isoform X2 [Exaiptasia diaphana]|uniref:Actin-binding LIM protein 1 n=1 Tax=Exaiptasia diaphana TaxID=2652724 RepID=A0A913Y1N9_EXADI|nr:actin-binding LIM protein 1 isoform X2 [Exaiptasia diaphana]
MGEGDVSCWGCRKPCLGEVLNFEDHFFHTDCLNCKVCNCQLANKTIYNYEDHYYCSDHYFQRYGQKCFVCREFIEGEALIVHGNVYHEACFACSICRKPFPEGEEIVYDGKTYKCNSCANPPKSPSTPSTLQKCAGCGDQLRGSQALLALEKQWHLWCFKCCQCGSLLSGEYMAKDGQPYCEKCYQNLYGIACAGCGSFITGKVLQAGSKHFHPRCSRCAKCNQVFGEGEEMYLQGNEIWHPRCTEGATIEIKQSKDVQSSPAPEPPVRTASHHTDWNVRYQQNGLPEEKPVREPKPRPHSYHEASVASQSYSPPSSGMDQVLQRNFHHSDSELSALQQPQKYYPYEQLKTSNFKLPKGIDKTKLETYLSDQDFFDVFSMARVDFYTLPAWKQRDFKKKKLLF